MLDEIVQEVRDFSARTKTKQVPILFDGGVRNGSDVLKALAKGADLVLFGRPILWGLAARGQQGVEDIIRIITEELKEAMLSCGCMNVSDIKTKNIIYT